MEPQQMSNAVANNLHQFRIKRGALAIGTDGPLGTIEQIVVDRASGELRMLIIHPNDQDHSTFIELPATHILHDHPESDEVYLDIGSDDLARDPALAQPYQPEQYAPIHKEEAAQALKPFQPADLSPTMTHPVVTSVEDDAAQLVMPTHVSAPAPTVAPEPVGMPIPEQIQEQTVQPELEAETPQTPLPEVPSDATPLPFISPMPVPSRDMLTTTIPLRAVRTSMPVIPALTLDETESETTASEVPEAADAEIPSELEAVEEPDEPEWYPQERAVYALEPEVTDGVEIHPSIPMLMGVAAAGFGLAALVGSLLLLRRRHGIMSATSAPHQPYAVNSSDRFGRGMIAGAILGLLVAPMSGEQLRERMRQQLRDFLHPFGSDS